MEKQNYKAVINANVSPQEAVEAVSNVAGWWTQNLEGASKNEGDVFTVRFGETFVTFKITEVIPGKKVVWLATDCYLHWLNDKTEWTGTQMVFEIVAEGEQTQISVTHVGLVPEIECYDSCVKGWDFYIKQSLFKLLTEKEGTPEKINANT
jgi:hypothetical protein